MLITRTTPRPLLTRIAFALLWLFVFTLPLAQATEIPLVGPISRLVGFAAMAAGAVAIAARRKVRYLGAVHMTMAGFILWSAITLCWSIAPELTVQRILTYLQLFVVVVLVWEFCEEEASILKLLGAFVLGTIIPAGSTMLAFLPGQRTLIERAAVDGFDPNTLPYILALSLPAAYYLIMRDKTPISALYRVQMGFAICAVLLSGTAITIVAMAVGLTLVCWTVHIVPIRTRVNAFLVFLMLGGAALLMIPTSMWEHMSQESRNGGITLTSAIDSGIETIHSIPAGGFGAGSMSADTTHAPANRITATMMISETGLVGVACFAAMLGVLFLSAESLSGVTKSFWLTILGVWTVGGLSLNWECTQTAWLLFGLLAAHSACLKRDGVTSEEQTQKRNYYVEGAEVWS